MRAQDSSSKNWLSELGFSTGGSSLPPGRTTWFGGAEDERIWQYADVEGFEIVSMGEDFQNRSARDGPPHRFCGIGQRASARIACRANGTFAGPFQAVIPKGLAQTQNAKTGSVLMDERSADDIVRAIARLRQASPARSATRAYAEQFSWQPTTDGQLALFRRVLKVGGG